MEENKVKVVQGYVESKRRRLSWEGLVTRRLPLALLHPLVWYILVSRPSPIAHDILRVLGL